ncbi:hypothetical protein THUN1379_19770 [Paludibacterium sp. THUN1379]|uniref:hypothetical protein n=1 Tax=Paludibacterium sp. THUN1379 TaxID=3112107 RepID=UPI0030874DAF|nr:hypothetical protein THUN1379_19770 [Paludibacterium sp. THUN1379]
MQALLRFALFAGTLFCGVGMIRLARRPDALQAQKIGRGLHYLTWLCGVLLVLWLLGLARH